MFDETLRRLERLGRGVEVSIELPVDEAGYLDRKCPGEKCGVVFKVLFEDWRDKVRQEEVFCPFCRHEEPADEWNTSEQLEHVKSVGRAYLQREIGRAFSADARRHNQRERSRPRGGMIDISMRMEYKPGPRPLVVPIRAAEVLRQEFTCEECECRWASFGASFFCPSCGHNSAATMFDRTLEVVRETVDGLPKVREALATASSPETAADAVRQLVEDQFSRLVGAFERLSEALFDQLPTASGHPKQGNVFQRVDDGSALWQAAAGQGYDAHLSGGELGVLRLRFQQRHVLGHKQGIVDQLYIDRSGDTSYSVGQRLVIREHDVLELADVVEKLAGGLRGVVQKTKGNH